MRDDILALLRVSEARIRESEELLQTLQTRRWIDVATIRASCQALDESCERLRDLRYRTRSIPPRQ